MSLTSAQQAAVAARGNVLVVAGAGTGKTRTLVERCLSCLLKEKPPASLQEVLIVTFTEAAAAEMRERIRARLEAEQRRQPNTFRWHEELAFFDTAHIGTLHSFCLRLVRQHFYELELDPQLTVLSEQEARLLAEETLDALLADHYAGQSETAEAVQQLIQTQGRGWDKPVRTLVSRLHYYMQTLPNPQGWLTEQLAMFAAPEPSAWRHWLLRALADWRKSSLDLLREIAPANGAALQCLNLLEAMSAEPSRETAGAVLEKIRDVPAQCPGGKKGEWLEPLKNFFADAGFLFSLARAGDSSDPLTEDWNWVRSHMAALLRLAREFNEQFQQAKRELGALDFHDLEQYALRLLWDPGTNGPTAIAHQWRNKLRFVFVDEYQDINAAQDRIIQALSREGASANRFLVGDIKQSIYGFRLANPRIFQRYLETWNAQPETRNPQPEPGTVIPLVENFRSREMLLEFINSIFRLVMRRDPGGMEYDELARLRFGDADERASLSARADGSPRVELHLRLKNGNPDIGYRGSEAEEPGADALARVAEIEEANKEARLVALRLRELKAQRHQVWDNDEFRPVEWKDMAVLLRAPANKAEAYAKEFSQMNVPLVIARTGFYQSLEISDLLSLLQILDNPRQDLPLLAVLRSPLVGLTLDELAAIRLAFVKGQCWTALSRWHEVREKASGAKHQVSGKEPDTSHLARGTSHQLQLQLLTADRQPRTDAETFGKVDAFLRRFTHWRRLARQVSLSHCLEAVLAETHYAEWLLTQPRGQQRHTNVQRLLDLAQQFDQFQRQGLFRFLRFVEAQQATQAEPEVAALSDENAVRLMSIHQSKGLEFPVVVVADLAKAFNLADLRAEIILDEEFGLCPQIKPPHTGQRYPSLPFWLAQRRQKRELRGEELRLLYVAMTRARDTLLLSATISAKKFQTLWQRTDRISASNLFNAQSYADWLGAWFAHSCASKAGDARHGETPLARWTLHDDAGLLALTLEADVAITESPDELPDGKLIEQLRQRLAWEYPFLAATRKPAKSTVTALRRQAAELLDAEAKPLFERQGPRGRYQAPHLTPDTTHLTPPHTSRLTAPAGVDIGTAHHKFLQLLSLDSVLGPEQLKNEIKRLQNAGLLSLEELELLDASALAAFWESEYGKRILANAPCVRRELAFTARFSPAELADLPGEPADASLSHEFITVQGVVDLAVLLPAEIWIVDFKTDELESTGALDEKVQFYAPQLKLYARALSRIYSRPVSECWLHFLSRQTTVALKP